MSGGGVGDSVQENASRVIDVDHPDGIAIETAPRLEPRTHAPREPSLDDLDAAALAHPVVLVDPRPATLLAVHSLRRRGVPLHVLSGRWLEPAFRARGVRRHCMPQLSTQPQSWSGRLLELAAHLEPRGLLLPCSKPARELLRRGRSTLGPHYALPYLEPLDVHDYEAEDFRTERALRRTVLRGEPAFEVQLTVDAHATCTGACVLTWVSGSSPHVVVTSVEGQEVIEASLEWLRPRDFHGYARLIWAPNRFGRVELQAAGTLPGTGWALAHEDGVDFPALCYASAAGLRTAPQNPRRHLSRQIPISESARRSDVAPLVPFPIHWALADPLPWITSLLSSFLRR
jgi:hypothetical protein